MNGICKALSLGLLVVAGAAGAQLKPFGPPPAPDLPNSAQGKTYTVGFYFCPELSECAVTVKVAKPATGTVCTFTMIGDDSKAFFFIDRNTGIEKQVVAWSLVAADAGWRADYAAKGIDFTEGVDHAETPASAPAVRKWKIKKNGGAGNRRSLLLYDIHVNLTNLSDAADARKTITCDPYGPGIINRGD